MKLRGVIIRLSPFGTGAIFHKPTGKAFLFTKDRVISKDKKVAVGQEVEFTLKESRIPGQPRTAANIAPKKIFHGVIRYLDPVDRGITSLVGEIISGDNVYLFKFKQEDRLELKMNTRFYINKKGVAILLKKKTA